MLGPNFKLLCIYTATGHTHSPPNDVAPKIDVFPDVLQKIIVQKL